MPADKREAFRWFMRAAQEGLVIAQFNVGNLYLVGQGVEKDAGAGVKWLRRAAEAGSAPAQHSLGVCFRDGRGVEADAGAAREWFARAAANTSVGGKFVTTVLGRV